MKVRNYFRRMGMSSLVVLGCISPMTHAFGGGPGGIGRPWQMMHLLDELDIDNAQREQIFALVDEYQPQMRKLAFSLHDSRKALTDILTTGAYDQAAIEKLALQQGEQATQMVRVSGALFARVTALLTPAQRAELAEIVERAPTRHGRFGGQH